MSNAQNHRRGLSLPLAIVIASVILAVAGVAVAFLVVDREGGKGSSGSEAYKIGVENGFEAQKIDAQKGDSENTSFVLTCTTGMATYVVDDDATEEERADYVRGCKDGYNGAVKPKDAE